MDRSIDRVVEWIKVVNSTGLLEMASAEKYIPNRAAAPLKKKHGPYAVLRKMGRSKLGGGNRHARDRLEAIFSKGAFSTR